MQWQVRDLLCQLAKVLTLIRAELEPIDKPTIPRTSFNIGQHPQALSQT